jgi:hypothetical protein
VTSSWFFLSTLNYDARSTTHQSFNALHVFVIQQFVYVAMGRVWKDTVLCACTVILERAVWQLGRPNESRIIVDEGNGVSVKRFE